MLSTASVIKVAGNTELFPIHFFISTLNWSVGLGKIGKCNVVQD